jgi:hypothetical protein
MRDVSQHTVKTQALSVYRKLDVSSRGQAVQRLRQLGLGGSSVTAATVGPPPTMRLTLRTRESVLNRCWTLPGGGATLVVTVRP